MTNTNTLNDQAAESIYNYLVFIKKTKKQAIADYRAKNPRKKTSKKNSKKCN